MGFLDKLFKDDINKGVRRFNKTPGAVLIDVRGEEDYKNGHIPGSINIPEPEINNIENMLIGKSTPIFVYCLSGAKSWNATKALQALGYCNVQNIGGINKYTGKTETGDN